MCGLSDDQVRVLTHNSAKAKIKQETVILEQLWYSTTMQAYIQRCQNYDGTFFCKKSSTYSPIVDVLLMAWLFRVLHLDAIAHVTEGKDALENILLSEYSKKEKILLLGNSKHKESVLYAFDDKLRNSLAHGTFNVLDDATALFVGQLSAKQSAYMNFYLRIEKFSYIADYRNSFMELPQSLLEFAKVIYSSFFVIEKTASSNLVKREDEVYVYFDDCFRFEKVKDGAQSQDEQICNHIQNQGLDNLIADDRAIVYVIFDASVSNFEKAREIFPNVQIIPSNKLLEHLNIRVLKSK